LCHEHTSIDLQADHFTQLDPGAGSVGAIAIHGFPAWADNIGQAGSSSQG